jgi:hypothetical protein
MTTTKTLDLKRGMTVALPASLNAPAYRGTVDAVEPWILTAGPKAGQQATGGRGKNAPKLWTVRVVNLKVTGPAVAAADTDFADAETLNFAVTADHDFEVTDA